MEVDRDNARHTIKIASWNICRGIHKKEAEIKDIVVGQQINVLMLQEIDVENYSEELLSIPNFTAFVHPGQKKRACTFVQNGIFQNVEYLDVQDDRPEVWLLVEEKGGRKTVIANIYREWCSNQHLSLLDLSSRIETLSIKGRLVVAGDFNLDPSHTNDQTYGSKLLTNKFLEDTSEFGMHRQSFGPTFHRTVMGKSVKSELDWVMSNVKDLVQNPCKKSNALSDHDLIMWEMSENGEVSQQKTRQTIQVRSYSKIDKKKFTQDLAQQPWQELVICTYYLRNGTEI